MSTQLPQTGAAVDRFLREISRHEMHVLRDDGIHRHLRFKRSDSSAMSFDIVTWPDHLCYTGDMGTFVFSRLEDMFQFFRREVPSNDQQGQGEDARELFRNVDLRYWAEKCLSADAVDGISRFNQERFRAYLLDHVEQRLDGDDDWTPERRKALLAELNEEVLDRLDDSYGEADIWRRVHEFRHDGFEFRDLESNCHSYTLRFQWCALALRWGIRQYDLQRQGLAQPA